MKDWMDEFKKKKALWIHDGNMKRPHALLTSGKHSNGFFNSRIIISDELLLREAASDLNYLYTRGRRFNETKILARIIVGPQTGATKLAELLSHVHYPYYPSHSEMCISVSPAKVGEGQDKKMVFAEDEHFVLFDKSVLLCEDVITTGGSIRLTAVAVTEAGGIILPFVLALVNRSGLKEIDGRKILALINRPMPTWEPVECPLCKEGSEAFRPKDNWALLNEEC